MKNKFSVKVAGNRISNKSSERAKARFNFDESSRIVDVKEIKKRVRQGRYKVSSHDVAEKILSSDAESHHFSNWIRRKLVLKDPRD